MLLAAGADYVVQMDADFSHPPTAIRMMSLMADYDVVVGSRYVRGGELDERWGWWRRFSELVGQRSLVAPHPGPAARDITAGFKCWRRATLLGIGLQRVCARTATPSRSRWPI